MGVSPYSNYLIAYHTIGCHQDTHHALEVQIHEMITRVDWMERLGSLKIGVSPCSNLPDSLSYSSRSAGYKPRNDSLNGTNRDTEDEGYSLLQLPDSLSYD